MVTRLLLVPMLLWLLPYSAFATPRLSIETDKPHIEFGKPLQLKIHGIDVTGDLAQLDLSPLATDFALDSRQLRSETSPNGRHRQTLVLKLYPRRSGRLDIPSLEFNGFHTRVRTLEVSEGTHQGKPITVNFSQSTSHPWERQQVLLTLEIQTPDPFATLRSNKLHIPGFEIIPLPFTREQAPNGDTKLRAGWALFSHRSGAQQITLPPLDYYRDGIQRRRYYLPPVMLQVRPLPPYIPPTLPVGKVSITSTLDSHPLQRTETLAYWTIVLRSATLAPAGFPPILRQIRSDRRISIFPATSERTVQPDHNGVQGKVIHRIPFKSLTSGRLALPELHYQYFDPDLGRLVTIRHQAARPLTLSIGWLLLLGIGFVYGLYKSGQYLLRQMKRFYRHKQLLRLARQQLQQATDMHALRTALRASAAAHAWPSNICLLDWAARWRLHYQTDARFLSLIEQLSAASYGPSIDTEVKALAIEFIKYLNAPRRQRKKPVAIASEIWSPESFARTEG